MTAETVKCDACGRDITQEEWGVFSPAMGLACPDGFRLVWACGCKGHGAAMMIVEDKPRIAPDCEITASIQPIELPDGTMPPLGGLGFAGGPSTSELVLSRGGRKVE